MAKVKFRWHKASKRFTCKRKGRQFYFTVDEDESLARHDADWEDYDAGEYPPDRQGGHETPVADV